MGRVVGLLVVALIAVLMYKFYFAKVQNSGAEAGTPAQTIDIVGVKNDLIGIAQAERAYQTENGVYAASLDELTASGALSMSHTGRDGYTYAVETSDSSFRAVAHCPTQTRPGCTSWAVNESMEVEPVR